MPMRYLWICFFLLLISFGGALAADEADLLLDGDYEDIEALYGDEEFVSIATGSRKPVYKAPAVASVITAKQIEEMGARNLDEVLETVPGLHVVPSALNRLNSIYSIRGVHTGENPQVLMLMNGVPFQLLSSGGRPLNFQLPVSAISRVEVLRGPGSAVYGADAYSGVINIITKSANEINGSEIGVRYGSFKSKDLWLQHGDTYGNLDVIFSLEWQKSDGDRDRIVKSDFQTLFDPVVSHAPGPLETRYDVLDIHLEMKWKDWSFRNWYWRQQDAGVGAGGAQALDPTGHDDIDTFLADLRWENDTHSPEWSLMASLNYYYASFDTHFLLLPPGTSIPIGTDGNLNPFAPAGVVTFPDGLIGNPAAVDQQFGIDLAAVFKGFSNHRLRVGAGIKYQDEDTSEAKNFGPGVIDGTVTPIDGTLTNVSNTPFVYQPDTHRTLWYLSLQDEWQLAPDWDLTSGVRYDHYSDFGSTINPRIALVWATRYNLTTKVLYGRAFRAPSFGEQFQQNNPVVRGNPNLDPETIDTIELAFDYRPTFDLHTNLSIFGYQADGLIEFVAGSAQNARDQEGYGFELETSWDATNQLTLMGSYAWQHSEDTKTGKRVADAPGQQLLLAANWRFMPDWLLHPQINWVANRHRPTDDTRDKVNDYILVNLTLRRTNIFNNIDFKMVVRNIFDEDAREPSTIASNILNDYPLEGRSLWAEFSYRF